MRFLIRKLTIETRADGFRELALTRADEAGVAKMADKTRHIALKVEGLKSAAGNILKQEMLAIGGDAAVARGVINCSTPTTDVIIMGTRKQLTQLIRRLKPQPFGLKALADQIRDELHRERGELALSCVGRDPIPLTGAPLVMGIVNVTPDSFSDGGDRFAFDDAIGAAVEMVAQGADLLDIGGESSRPGADPVSLEEELRRVIPVVETLAGKVGVPLSIDTYKAEVARRAVAAGASIVNDISGLRLDPLMAGTVAELGVPVCLMHMRGDPRVMQDDTRYDDLVGEVYARLAESVRIGVEAGIAREKIIIDPGIGFGKDAGGNLTLLRRLEEFHSLGLPLLVGVSRKAFIGKTLGIDAPKERLEGSLAAASWAVAKGAQIIRVHDVGATVRAVRLTQAIRDAG